MGTVAALTLTSSKNPLLKDVRRAVEKGVPTADGLWVAESPHLLEEALRSDCEVVAVLAAERAVALAEKLAAGRVSVTAIADAAFQAVASTETSQGVLALVRPPVWTVDDLFRAQPLVVVLEGLQDPGNAGAIVRAAEAFGATGVVRLANTVNFHHPKFLRAAAGSAFRVPGITFEAGDLRQEFERRQVAVYATAPESARDIADVDWRSPSAVVMGAEGRGVSESWGQGPRVCIPTRQVESLNAAVAAGVILYEAQRQRSAR